MFKLPSHSLDVGTTYEFRVDVTDSGNYTSFATQVSWQKRFAVSFNGTLRLLPSPLQKNFSARMKSKTSAKRFAGGRIGYALGLCSGFVRFLR